MTDYAPQLERKPAWPVALNTLTSTLVAGGIAAWAGFVAAPPTGWYADQPFTPSITWLRELFSSAGTDAVTAEPVFRLLQHPASIVWRTIDTIDSFDLIVPLTFRLVVIVGVALITAVIVGLYAYRGLDKVDRLKHIRGRRLLKGAMAIRQARHAQRKSISKSGRGIDVAPRIPISLETETKHFLLVGASGGGKTQTLLFWIDQLLRDGAKILIHDTKGDMTASLPDDDFILLAPHDARSWAWQIAKDCQGLAAARELAGRLIPAGREPMWTNGAREILTGVIRYLQLRHGDQWDWRHLRDTAFSSPLDLQALLMDTHPEGARLVEVDEKGIPHKTSFSFLVTLWSSIGSIVSPLAAAWSDIPEERRVSLTAWLNDEGAKRRTFVLQRSSEFSDLSEAWIGAAVQLMANYAASAGFGDSPSRRIWLVLDEFAQLGKLKGFQQFLEVGRSRGIRCALGVQDLEQLSELYGPEARKTWLNTIETKIICRMNAGPSAKFIAEELIGQREVSWTEKTVTWSPGSLREKRGSTRSVNKQVRTAVVPVVLPDFLERDLGLVETGGETKIRALLLTGGNLYQADWPITIWPERRPAAKPAAWTVA
ncbi:type IV secretion system DNA-binding domain-containing protein [Shumkonia mesophila]|uniref:type IV secretion system DNA-binding domain-containing protein n=1 Tax=Shumkonia mesophila TaxID=2838854 RepID=UPI002934B9A0|nr:type IV secretion system DNA-binding domain-containing protein [Shumkonia mesophila]